MLVAKIAIGAAADMLHKEGAGLTALSESGYLLLPTTHPVMSVGDSHILLMQYLEQTQESEPVAEDDFGVALAHHHTSSVGKRYGWDHNNYIGSTVQVNEWSDDWIEFNRECRLGCQLELARSAGLLRGEEASMVGQVISRLDSYIPRTPPMSLLHGDLWSGNALPVYDGKRVRIALIDPAVYFGDPIADVAMMKLFGGFQESCYAAYFSHAGETDRIETRVLVYQLYHMLNHLNLFGGGYLGSVMGITRRLLRAQ
ncbi:MAG: fructosamine kinase family protein [Phycisphaerales bacterium]